MRISIGAVLLVVAVSACGGGSSAIQPPAGAAGQDATTGTSIESTIVVPSSHSSQTSARRPNYVSMSSQGLSITVTDVPPTGQTASFAPITSTFQLTSGPNLVVAPTPASASGHTEDVTYVVYDTPPASGAFPGTAKALGWALTSGLVIHPGKNTNDVVLSGVVDSFAPPLAQSGSFGMMGPSPPTLLGTQTTLGFGAAMPANGIATMIDADTNNITTATGGPWPVIGAVPTSATASSPGVPVSVVETAGTCGAVGVAPHLELSFNGGAVAPTSAIARTDGALRVIYDGDGGVGWSAVVSAKGVTQTLTYTLSSLGATSTSADFNCANQTLSFSHSNESAVVTIVQPTAATPYTITVPSTANCQQLVDVYNGNSTAAPMMIPYATPTVLTASTFTIQLISSPPAAAMCPIEIQDANAVAPAATGGAAFPGATTYVAALLPSNSLLINVP